MKRVSIASITLATSLGIAQLSCGPEHVTFAEHGAQLARDATIANNRYNAFTCLTCHAEHASDVGSRIYPGAVLETAAIRTSWWGGSALDLHTAVEYCFTHFMGGPRLDPESDTAQALDAWLMDLAAHAPTADTTPVPFTVPPSASDLPLGDATRGGEIYAHASQPCHAGLNATSGRLGTSSSIPQDTLTTHLTTYGPACTRVTFVEKIRHGSFLGLAGVMPPFSMETLSDEQVSDVLAYLGAPSGGTCSP
jgi:thiosulfate dehydrogenase